MVGGVSTGGAQADERPGHAGVPVGRRSRFWDWWLIAVTTVLAALGVGLALANGTGLFGWLHHGINGAFWRGGPPGQVVRDYQRWVFAVVGATLAGWGVMMTAVARLAFWQRQRWAWLAIAASAATWFALDTAASVAAQVWVNVGINVACAVALAVPLAATRSSFRSREEVLRSRSP